MVAFVQALVNGFLIGGIYALIATGLSLIWGVMRIINWAHGAMVMFSMYLIYFANTLLGLDPLIALPLVALTMFCIGYILQWVLMERILNRPLISKLAVTFGLMVFLENLALFLWSPNWRSVNVAYGTLSLHVGGISISFPRFLSFIIALVIAVGLFQFLNRTELGRVIRATAQNREAASLMGVNPYTVYRLAFGLGLALTGVAGSLLMTFYYVFPKVGFPFALTAYVVVVLGGLGNLKGAVLGGLILGIAEALGAFLIAPPLKGLVAFGIFMLVLFFKPEGLFGGVTE